MGGNLRRHGLSLFSRSIPHFLGPCLNQGPSLSHGLSLFSRSVPHFLGPSLSHHHWTLNRKWTYKSPLSFRPKGRPHGSKATFSHNTSTKRNPSKYGLAAHKPAREIQALSHHECEEPYIRAFENHVRAEQAAGAQAETLSQPPAERTRHRGERRGEVILRGRGRQRGRRGRGRRTTTGGGGQGVENPVDPVGDIATVQSQQMSALPLYHPTSPSSPSDYHHSPLPDPLHRSTQQRLHQGCTLSRLLCYQVGQIGHI